MQILITGAAGFIGFHLSKKLLDESNQIIGIDNMNDYYDPKLKEDRLTQLNKYDSFNFQTIDLKNKIEVGHILKPTVLHML